MVLHSKLRQPIGRIVGHEVHGRDQGAITLRGRAECQIGFGEVGRKPSYQLSLYPLQCRVQHAVDPG